MRAKGLVGVMVAAAMAIICGSASAATYCVPAHAGCSGIPKPTLADAVTAANGDPAVDDIFLASGTFGGGVSIGAYPVHIHGSGKDVTRIEGGAGGLNGVNMDQPDSSIEDVTIHELPGGHPTGLSLGGSARGVVVDQRDNASSVYAAVILRGEASFEDGAALAPLTSAGADYGIAADSTGPMLVSGAQVQGRYAMTTSGPGPVTIRFVGATGDIYGLNASADNTLLEDSTVSGGPVVGYLFGGSNDIVTTVRHVTVNGSYVGAESDNHTSKVILSNTAIVGGGTDPETPDIELQQFGGTARVEADYSFFRAGHVIFTPGAGIQYVPGTHNIDGADAKLLDVTRGDLRPRFDSPLIDAGDPVPGGGEPMADLVGEFRAVNGRTDIGAYEYGRHTPTLSASASPLSALVGQAVTFTAATADADPSEFPTVTWTFDDGTPPAAGYTVTHAFTSPGAHTVTATAADPAGLTASAPTSVAVTVPFSPARAMAPAFGFKKLKARKGVVGVLLSCPVIATDCAGTIELRLAPKPKATGGAAKTVVLGKARYALGHGTHKTIRVKLNRSARRRLARARHGLRVRVVAKPKGATPKSKTVRLTGR